MNPVLIYMLVGFGIGNVTGAWKPLAIFHKRPETAQLSQLQADLSKAQLDAAAAVKAVEDAKGAERAKLEAQIRAAQVDAAGVNAALSKAAKSPETTLASRMAQRVSLKLATAIGVLPPDQQQAMVELIDQALSDKQAEVDAANAKLAIMDADFKATTAQRDALKAELPILSQRAVKAEETAKAVQDKVTVATDTVKRQAL